MLTPDEKHNLVTAIARKLGYSFDQGHGRAAGAAYEIIAEHVTAMTDALQADPRSRMVETGEDESPPVE